MVPVLMPVVAVRRPVVAVRHVVSRELRVHGRHGAGDLAHRARGLAVVVLLEARPARSTARRPGHIPPVAAIVASHPLDAVGSGQMITR